MKKHFLQWKLFLGVLLAILVACDKDYNTIGTEDIVGGGNFDFKKYTVENIQAFTKPTGAVQSNNLPINGLGTFDNTPFGTSTYSFVVQPELEKEAPSLGYDIEMRSTDSVYLYIPLFTGDVETSASGTEPNTFKLDSIHGNLSSPFDLKIYRSSYLLQDFDATDPTIAQRYYSDEAHLIESNLMGIPLNDATDTAENTNFLFSGDERVIYETDGSGGYVDSSGNAVSESDRVVKERLAPGIWINLNKQIFETAILNAPSNALFNNNNFKEYFRGLYFKATPKTGETGALAKMNLSKGYIVVQYHAKDSQEASAEFKKKSVVLNLTGKTVNFFDNTFSSTYQNALDNSSTTQGNENFYIKGGNGSTLFINLFGEDTVADGESIPDELKTLREQGWLINDAHLTFTVKHTTEGINQEAQRIYVYDATNGTTILDYISDSSTTSDTKSNKYLYGGIVEKNNNGDGVKYRIRLTAYINNLLNKNITDFENVQLGVCVTENINNATFAYLKNSFTTPLVTPSTDVNEIISIPLSSVINPLGNVIYGTANTVDEENRLKLEIYYSQPN